nr:hypothetical protein CFP56_18794 [Quercus suber]
MHGSAQEDVPESKYGPWIMVVHKKQGPNQQKVYGTMMKLAHGQPRAGKETRSYMPLESLVVSTGPSRDFKRKLTPQRTIDGLQITNAIQCLVKERLKPAIEVKVTGPSLLHIEKDEFRPGKEANSFKPNDIGSPAGVMLKPNKSNPLASVKGKKGKARNKTT